MEPLFSLLLNMTVLLKWNTTWPFMSHQSVIVFNWCGEGRFPPGTVSHWHDGSCCWVIQCSGEGRPVPRNPRRIFQLMEELCPCHKTRALFSPSLSWCFLLATSNHHQCSNIQKSLTLKWRSLMCKARSRSALWTRWVYYSSMLGICVVHMVALPGFCLDSAVIFCNTITFICLLERYSQLLLIHNPHLLSSKIFTNEPTQISFRPPDCTLDSK